MSDFISDDYRAQLLQLYERGDWGGGGKRFAKDALQLLARVGGKSILDYGCGPGTFRQEVISRSPNIAVFEYDPAIPGKEAPPAPADLVLCADVLEHIEPAHIQAVLRHVHDLARKAALMIVSLRPAEKRLPDGRNAHLIIDNASWWLQQFRQWDDWKVVIKIITKRPDIGYFTAVKYGE